MNKKNLVPLLVIILSVLIGSESEKPSSNMDIDTIKKVDLSFSSMARQAGLLKAYDQFLDSEGIVLPMNGYPIKGEKNLKQLGTLIDTQIKQFKIQWKPEFALVSRAGELAFTCGKYSLETGPKSKQARKSGYYGSVWKKNKNHEWRLLFSQGLFQVKVDNQPPGLTLKNKLSRPEKILVDTEHAFSYLSPSHDLGYNTGPYTYTLVAKNGRKNILKGYFFTVWIKEEGKWRFFYDGGNQVSGS